MLGFAFLCGHCVLMYQTPNQLRHCLLQSTFSSVDRHRRHGTTDSPRECVFQRAQKGKFTDNDSIQASKSRFSSLNATFVSHRSSSTALITATTHPHLRTTQKNRADVQPISRTGTPSSFKLTRRCSSKSSWQQTTSTSSLSSMSVARLCRYRPHSQPGVFFPLSMFRLIF